MMIYEVTQMQQFMIKKLFGNFVFNRIEAGKYFVKVSKGQYNKIKQYLAITLINGTPESNGVKTL